MTELAPTVRENVRRKAREDHAAGLPRDAHHMNPSRARDDYLAERDWCERFMPRQAEVAMAEITPP